MSCDCYDIVTNGSQLLESTAVYREQARLIISYFTCGIYDATKNGGRKKGQLREELPFSVPRGGTTADCPPENYGR